MTTPRGTALVCFASCLQRKQSGAILTPENCRPITLDPRPPGVGSNSGCRGYREEGRALSPKTPTDVRSMFNISRSGEDYGGRLRASELCHHLSSERNNYNGQPIQGAPPWLRFFFPLLCPEHMELQQIMRQLPGKCGRQNRAANTYNFLRTSPMPRSSGRTRCILHVDSSCLVDCVCKCYCGSLGAAHRLLSVPSLARLLLSTHSYVHNPLHERKARGM